ncbi:MAG: hypothetical protein WC124_00100 [Desulfoplanes sp.]
MSEENDLCTELIGKSRIKDQLIGSFYNFKLLCAFDFAFYRHSSKKHNFKQVTKVTTKSPYITFISNPEIFIGGEYAYYAIQSIRRAANEYYYKFRYNSHLNYTYNVKGFFNDIEYRYESKISVSKKYKHTIEINFRGRPMHSETKNSVSVELLDFYDLNDMYFVEKLMKNAFSYFSISSD